MASLFSQSNTSALISYQLGPFKTYVRSEGGTQESVHNVQGERGLFKERAYVRVIFTK